jgi:hypothetical protein
MQSSALPPTEPVETTLPRISSRPTGFSPLAVLAKLLQWKPQVQLESVPGFVVWILVTMVPIALISVLLGVLSGVYFLCVAVAKLLRNLCFEPPPPPIPQQKAGMAAAA